MKERKAYVEPTIESIDMSATAGAGSCGGSVPPINLCPGGGPVQAEPDPSGPQVS